MKCQVRHAGGVTTRALAAAAPPADPSVSFTRASMSKYTQIQLQRVHTTWKQNITRIHSAAHLDKMAAMTREQQINSVLARAHTTITST
jgi:hypothetical protein